MLKVITSSGKLRLRSGSFEDLRRTGHCVLGNVARVIQAFISKQRPHGVTLLRQYWGAAFLRKGHLYAKASGINYRDVIYPRAGTG